MKRLPILIILLNVLLLGSCNQPSPETPVEPGVTPIAYKAVYLTNGPGELADADLKAHPELIVALAFDDFKSHVGAKIALWIDKNAVAMVEPGWLNLPQQKYYPMVIVGYNDPLYCFRDTLAVGTIEGPYVDWSQETLEPGFCVWMIQEENSSGVSSVFRGYDQIPAVKDILDVTNPLLEEMQDIQPRE